MLSAPPQPTSAPLALGQDSGASSLFMGLIKQLLSVILMKTLQQVMGRMTGNQPATPASSTGSGSTGGATSSTGGAGNAGNAAPPVNTPPAEANGSAPPTVKPPAPEIPNVDFRKLNGQERTNLSGLGDRDRAVLHLWGRQMIAKGFQDGGILLTVQETIQKGANDGSVVVNKGEADLTQELIAKDMQKYGGITGKSLDEEFFRVTQKITGKDLSQRYANAPVRFADGPAKLPGNLAVDSPEWEQALEKQNGLNQFENAVLRLWGHNPVFTGKIDGAILPFTLNNPNSLDKGMNKSDVNALLKADLASDGILNGDSLSTSFDDVLDKLYLGQGGTSVAKVNADAQATAAKLNRTPQDIAKSTTQGVQSAIQNVGKMMKDHPVITGMAVGGMMAATAVCPFLAGLGAGTAGVAMAQKFMNR